MSRRGERLLWQIVEFLGHGAMFGLRPPPQVTGDMRPAEAEPVIGPRELDDWLASVLGTEPDCD